MKISTIQFLISILLYVVIWFYLFVTERLREIWILWQKKALDHGTLSHHSHLPFHGLGIRENQIVCLPVQYVLKDQIVAG